MGDRASYAIREHGKTQVYYSQFGASTLLADIFWSPESCEAQIKKQEKSNTWLDDVFGEAAVALCKDTRTVTFYDCRYDESTLALAAQLMTALWPGWQVRQTLYVSGVAATLGVVLPPKVSLTPKADSNFLLADLHEKESNVTSLIYRLENGVREALVSSADILELMSCGPRMLLALKRAPSFSEAREALRCHQNGDGSPRHLFRNSDLAPRAVSLIDCDKKSIHITLLPRPDTAEHRELLGTYSTRWPGWSVSAKTGTPKSFFDALGETMPSDIDAPVATRLAAEELEELGSRLLGDDAMKRFSMRWLAGIETTLGKAPGTLSQNSMHLHDASLEEREARFQVAIDSLDLPKAETREVLSRAKEAVRQKEQEKPKLNLEPSSLKLVETSVIECVDRTFYGICQPFENRVAVGAPKLMHWVSADAKPTEICGLPVDALGSENRINCPTDARLSLSPSGRGLCAISESSTKSMVYVDLQNRKATLIGLANRLAKFSPQSRVEFCPVKERLAVEVLQDLPDAYKCTCVVIYDAEDGWVGEVPHALISGWEGDRLFVKRAELSDSNYTFRKFECNLTAYRELLATARMLGQSKREDSSEASQRARMFESDRELSASLKMVKENNPSAITHAESAFTLDPTSHVAFLQYRYLLSRAGRFRDCANLCTQYLEKRPYSREGFLSRSIALQKLQHYQEALDDANRCCEVAPFWQSSHRQKACVLSRMGRFDEAEESLLEAHRCYPQEEQELVLDEDFQPLWGRPGLRELDYVRLCALAEKAESIDEKKLLLQKAIDLSPKRGEAHQLLLKTAQTDEECIQLMESWYRADPENLKVLLKKFEMILSHERFDEAEKILAHAAAIGLAAYEIEIYRAKIAWQRGDQKTALALLRNGRIIFEESKGAGVFEDAVDKVGELDEILGWELAERELIEVEKQLATDAANVELAHKKCELLFAVDRVSEAETVAKKLVERFPNDHVAYLRLAQFALHGENEALAQAHLSRARELYEADSAQSFTFVDFLYESFPALAELDDT